MHFTFLALLLLLLPPLLSNTFHCMYPCLSFCCFDAFQFVKLFSVSFFSLSFFPSLFFLFNLFHLSVVQIIPIFFFSYLNSFLILMCALPLCNARIICSVVLLHFNHFVCVCVCSSYFAKWERVSVLAFNRFKSVEFRRFNFTTHTHTAYGTNYATVV